MPRLFSVQRSKGRLSVKTQKWVKAVRPRLDELFLAALGAWLQTIALNTPVWSGRARASLVFATGNIRGSLANYLGVSEASLPIVPTAPNEDTLNPSSIAQGKREGMVRVKRPTNNRPENLNYSFTFTSNVPELINKTLKWPKGARAEVQAQGPAEAAALAAAAFREVMQPRIVRKLLLEEFRKAGK